MKLDKKGALSLSELPQLSIVFLLTAFFFVIGIIILASFQTQVVTTGVTVVNESFVMPADEGYVTLTHYRVTAISEVLNSTNARYPAANYTLNNPNTTTSRIQFHENATVCKTGATCRVTYVYDTYDSGTADTIQNTINAMSEIPNNWLLLIAVIAAAAVVIGIVISNLGSKDGMGRV